MRYDNPFPVYLLYRVASLNDTDKKHDDRNHKKDVDETSQDMEAEVSKKPKDDKNGCYGGKHT
jgi:hypothetical protein